MWVISQFTGNNVPKKYFSSKYKWVEKKSNIKIIRFEMKIAGESIVH